MWVEKQTLPFNLLLHNVSHLGIVPLSQGCFICHLWPYEVQCVNAGEMAFLPVTCASKSYFG